ncbi:YceI family protein [Runella rosea]|uniref:YceI family protein n=1 Tax=Runella rosea TaxID=2259595 RepID=A0A344THZ1_9BACT|nr:YceI family protein [Runella rosea]AXE18262.1 YceI family protein [Runella rosea]
MKARLVIPLIIIYFISFQAKSQLFITQGGETSFFSETPLENISALNKQVAAIINTSTSEVAVRIQNVAFHFPNKLMEEHFNENYMESEKYPNSTFKGKIQEVIDFKKEGVYDVSAKGILEMHGVKQERVIKGKLTVGKEQLTFVGNFDVKLADHKIEIPTLVMAKIAESLTVKNHFVFTQKK